MWTPVITPLHIATSAPAAVLAIVQAKVGCRQVKEYVGDTWVLRRPRLWSCQPHAGGGSETRARLLQPLPGRWELASP